MEYKKRVFALPQQIKDWLFKEQEHQGNKHSLVPFCKDIYAPEDEQGFDWDESLLGVDFWDELMSDIGSNEDVCLLTKLNKRLEELGLTQDVATTGIKESQNEPKAPIFTYCKVNKDAIEALAFRALYGHEKYKDGDQDWQNFKRVPNGEYEYSNAEFRHALGIGPEDEKDHLIAAAWNAVARLQIFLENGVEED